MRTNFCSRCQYQRLSRCCILSTIDRSTCWKFLTAVPVYTCPDGTDLHRFMICMLILHEPEIARSFVQMLGCALEAAM